MTIREPFTITSESYIIQCVLHGQYCLLKIKQLLDRVQFANLLTEMSKELRN